MVVDAFQHCFLGLGFGFGRGKDFLLCLQCHLSEKEGGLFLKEKFLGVVLMSQKRVTSLLRLFRSTVKLFFKRIIQIPIATAFSEQANCICPISNGKYIRCVYTCMHAKSFQSGLTLCDLMYHNLPGFSVHKIL